jgi:nitrogen-specific signal transduction histidine kinase
MAHEVNNPLMVIKGNIQLLVKEPSDPVSRQRMDAVLGAVDAIHEIVERMNRITELKLADQSRAEEWWSRYVAAPLPKNTVSK